MGRKTWTSQSTGYNMIKYNNNNNKAVSVINILKKGIHSHITKLCINYKTMIQMTALLSLCTKACVSPSHKSTNQRRLWESFLSLLTWKTAQKSLILMVFYDPMQRAIITWVLGTADT